MAPRSRVKHSTTEPLRSLPSMSYSWKIDLSTMTLHYPVQDNSLLKIFKPGNNVNPCQIDKPYPSLDNEAECHIPLLCF